VAAAEGGLRPLRRRFLSGFPLRHELPDTGDRIAQADDRGALLKALAQLPAGAEAQYQRTLMGEYGSPPSGVRTASDLIGKGWVFARLVVGDGAPGTVMDGAIEKGDDLHGRDIQSAALSLEAGNSDTVGASKRLVIGKLAPTARQVTCSWDDGTTTEVPIAPTGAGDTWELKPMIRPIAGSQPNWFACLDPKGKSFESVKVTK